MLPPNDTLKAQFIAHLTALKLSLDATTIEAIFAYAQLLHQWNQIHNLTGAKTLEDIVLHHIVDSLTIAPYIKGPNILDVGSGGGFPGVPLALVFPQNNFILLDSNHKKTRFLNHVVVTLDLKNVKAVCERVEKFSFAPGFDTIISRATVSLKKLWAWTKHLVAPQGQLLAMKGKYPADELKELKVPVQIERLDFPGVEAQRHVVRFWNLSINCSINRFRR